ncbi:MAG: cell wall hydrolase [Alphaproteobacteria bacterium]
MLKKTATPASQRPPSAPLWAPEPPPKVPELHRAAAKARVREDVKVVKRGATQVARSHLMSAAWLILIAGMGANAYANVVHPFARTADTAPIVVTAPQQAADADVHLLAATAWAEARSEGEEGMRAVAHVVLNRVGKPRFGDNLSDVVLHPKQFSAWNLGDPNRPLALHPEAYARWGSNHDTWITAQTVAREALEGRSTDPTSGALFYHTTAIHPYWATGAVGRHVIGHHVFYADVHVVNARLPSASPPQQAATTTQQIADNETPQSKK